MRYLCLCIRTCAPGQKGFGTFIISPVIDLELRGMKHPK